MLNYNGIFEPIHLAFSLKLSRTPATYLQLYFVIQIFSQSSSTRLECEYSQNYLWAQFVTRCIPNLGNFFLGKFLKNVKKKILNSISILKSSPAILFEVISNKLVLFLMVVLLQEEKKLLLSHHCFFVRKDLCGNSLRNI